MSARNRFLLILFKIFGKMQIIDTAVMATYKYAVFPLVRIYLHLSYPNLVKVEYRNSINLIQNFNAILSDLDITLIIKDDSDPLPLIKGYLQLKKYLIMLDYPEIYQQKESLKLDSFENSTCLNLIELCWNIRKINWSLDSLAEASDELNVIKKQRSINNSFKKILTSTYASNKTVFNLEDFKSFSALIPSDTSEKNLCYWSFFLETNHKNHLKIMLTTQQYAFLNSLMPGEVIAEEIKDKVSTDYLKHKLALEFHELFLSKSATRLKLAQGLDTKGLQEWIDYLEKKLHPSY